MRQFYTYLHCKPDGTPFYVGKGCDNKSNKRSHVFTCKRNPHHKNVIAKYGIKNILVFEFLCESEDQAFADEIQQIAQLRKDGYELTNKTEGGEGRSGATYPYRPKSSVHISKYKADEEREKRHQLFGRP